MKSIATKLIKVMEDCDYVQKDGKNSFHNYKYVSAANILEKVNESLVKNGLACYALPELISFEDVKTAKGNTEHLATVKMSVTLIDTESDESLEIIGLGSGQDVGDKAIMKAQTAALKYAWMLTLNISTGDDPEADSSVDERMTHTNSQPVQQKSNTAKTTQYNEDPLVSKGQIAFISKKFKEAGLDPNNQAQMKFGKDLAQLTVEEGNQLSKELKG